MHPIARLDHRYLWHPFTQMKEWLQSEPIVIASGKGSVLRDVRGKRYLDANASIWTNLHGHGHPKINAAIRAQLGKIAHSSALGLANEPASFLGKRLIQAANPPWLAARRRRPQHVAKREPAPWPGRQPRLDRVFYSDDGSTAMEVAVKLAYEYGRRTGRTPRPRFLSLEEAYHGDTLGAVSLGHIDLFHRTYAGLLFRSDKVMAPYCYRCPYNRARTERADARAYRRCHWECLNQVEQKFDAAKKKGEPYTALVVEPLVQGAGGMIPQPIGWLRRAAGIARGAGALLIADEVMTGFGRTGTLFASHQEQVQPDLMALSKGLTGGYLPMAATLTTDSIFQAFLGDYAEFKTFFHGHSYTGNQLAAAAALASLDLLQERAAIVHRSRLQACLQSELDGLWSLPHVGDIRQVGLIAGIELVKDWRKRTPYPLEERAGHRVCQVMRSRGVLSRPIGNVVVLMPPYSTTESQLRRMVSALAEGIEETLGPAHLEQP